jgi:polar amino acid transport system ATP-binding protein
MQPMVVARNVHKRYGEVEVLKGIDLEVETGKVVCIIGASGAGKSTFLRCINHLERPDQGYVLVDGRLVGLEKIGRRLHEAKERHLCAARAGIGMVFQRFNLFQHMTVLENVTLAPTLVQKVSRKAAVIPASCPAVNSSALPSRARSPWNLGSCSSTKRHRPSILSW